MFGEAVIDWQNDNQVIFYDGSYLKPADWLIEARKSDIDSAILHS